MHYFYIIYSKKTDKYYYGSTHDPELRLKLHNDGATKSTRFGIPWDLVYTEAYGTKTEALKREREVKRIRKRSFVDDLIKLRGPCVPPTGHTL